MLTHAQLIAAIPNAIDSIDLEGWGAKTTGKVRDLYTRDGERALITTDRVSAFDRVLGTIPYKGQVLNQLSLWWFEQVADVVANHVVASPDPNVTIAREAEALPVEVIVRGYITGVTSTSLWTLYEAGERQPYGITLPDGLKKNDKLPAPIITPTTKASGGAHDERLTRDQIIEGRLVEPALWEQIESAAIAIFRRGTRIAEHAGLILVDTKYEFGLVDGRLTLIDEVHTPDSSRYWTYESYDASGGAAPMNFDKEFLREWYVANGYRGDGVPPVMPPEVIAQVAERYIESYERLTVTPFLPAETPAGARIAQNVARYDATRTGASS
ncbi:MAG: phosphoribosylaminoimidazolesuccinocarboxamide synthase [Chloroflexota bacterium]|nr:phosphoribosylaminoimidazolesuccinocarboxamide synthase [Chloroflexota bacterium]